MFMESSPPDLPFLSNIGMMLTYKCSIACPHCIVEAGPHRKEEMPVDLALKWVKQASIYNNGQIKGLALTGGEPFFNLENLARISSYASDLGFIVSVVTNAFWARTFDQAVEVLTGLPAIKLLSVSTDVYHQKFVPLENIKNAVNAISALNRIFNIAVCTDTEENVEFKQIVHDLNEIGVGDKIRVSITYPAGRARLKGSCHSYPVAHEPTPGACQVASSPVIYPDGRVISCIGPLLTLPITHPMFLGNLHQECLNDILYRSELNHVLHTIRVWGPYKLVSLLQQNKSIELPEEYICNCPCDVCYKVFSHPGAYEALMTIFGDQRLQHSVAYARLHYLNESALVEHYRL
jgi:pyruvate-formate lyase-activating enzyme